MARAIWKGSISFGLINIPVSLFSAEQRSDIHFRMIDSRNRDYLYFDKPYYPEPGKAGEKSYALHAEEAELTSFLKTTGGKGLHVVVPIFR